MENKTRLSQAERLSNLETLIAETGFESELKARRRADIDKQRLALSVELAALPDPSRDLLALNNEAARAGAAFEAARTAFQECERQAQDALIRGVVRAASHTGAKQRILTELMRTAPSELKDALDDISFAGELLRCGVRIDETSNRTWLGARIKVTTTNIPAISDARAQLDEAREAVLDLMKNGNIASTEAVKRCEAILEAAMRPVFAFIDQRRWDQRRTISASDLVAEVSGFAN